MECNWVINSFHVELILCDELSSLNYKLIYNLFKRLVINYGKLLNWNVMRCWSTKAQTQF